MLSPWLVTWFYLGITSVLAHKYRCPGLKVCTCASVGNVTNSNEISIDCKDLGLLRIPKFDQFQNMKIRKLNLANNSFKSVVIDNKTFRDLKVYEIDLSHNRIDNITSHAFLPLKQTLKTLSLDNIGLRLDDLRFLKYMNKLEKLSLKHNMIKESRRFKRVIPKLNLIELRLSNNNFARISSNAFASVRSSLQVLYLENTNLDFNNLGFLSGLTKLQALFIGGNVKTKDLHSLKEPFKKFNLTTLRRLSFRNCKLQYIHAKFFTGVLNLAYLDLSGNLLPNVPVAISNLTKLNMLNLAFNDELDHIQEDSFRSLSHLKTLNMQGTVLRSIPGNTFAGLGNTLEELILSDTLLPGGHFWISVLKPLQSLRKLDISNNIIKYIVNDTFNYLISLEELDLSGNVMPLSKFTDTLFRGVENTLKKISIRNMNLKRLPNEALATLEELEILDASGNNFINISDNFFAGIKASKIILDNTQATTIERLAFSGLKGPVSLHMDKNNLSNLYFAEYVKPHYFKHLSLKQNPLQCDCAVVGLMYLRKAESADGVCTDGLTYQVRDIRELWLDERLLENCELSNGIRIRQNSVLMIHLIVFQFIFKVMHR